MATEHPAVTAARTAQGAVFQHTLTLAPHIGPQPAHRNLPTKADDPTAVLSAIAALGWELVTAGVIQHVGSTAIGMTYVWRR